MRPVREDFTGNPSRRWRRYGAGQGRLEPTGSTLRFVIADVTADAYANAQIADYQGLPRRGFLWRPPLRLSVQARFSHPAANGPLRPALSGTEGRAPTGLERQAISNAPSAATGLRGTAGFGFWNDPFLMTGARMPALPRAAWFFYASPPSNMRLDLHTPGFGWKAATIDALRPVALLLAPLALPAVLLMNLRPLYPALWPLIQRALNVREALVGANMTEWHTYTLEWGLEQVRFSVDQEPVLLDAPSPRGPLGFVMWMDSQYMVVTPQGRLGWGLLDVPGRQWMEADWLAIHPG